MTALIWLAVLSGSGPEPEPESESELETLWPPVLQVEQEGELVRVSNGGELPMGLSWALSGKGSPEGAWSLEPGEAVVQPGESLTLQPSVAVPLDEGEAVELLMLSTWEREGAWADPSWPWRAVPLLAGEPAGVANLLITGGGPDLGAVDWGGVGTAEIVLKNVGDADLELEAYLRPGYWGFVVESAPSVVAAGSQEVVRVSYSPPTPSLEPASTDLVLRTGQGADPLIFVELVVNTHLDGIAHAPEVRLSADHARPASPTPTRTPPP